MSKLPKYFLIATIIFFVPLFFRANALTLDSIGALETQGKNYSEWWYTGTNPTLAGTAGNGSDVSVTIDDSAQTTTTGEDGTWSFPTTTIGVGDYTIKIASEGSEIPFILHAGQEYTGQTAATTTATETTTETTTATETTTETTTSATVPETGWSQLLMLNIALLSIFAGMYLYAGTPDSKKCRSM
jgi:hypothetical protein